MSPLTNLTTALLLSGEADLNCFIAPSSLANKHCIGEFIEKLLRYSVVVYQFYGIFENVNPVNMDDRVTGTCGSSNTNCFFLVQLR